MPDDISAPAPSASDGDLSALISRLQESLADVATQLETLPQLLEPVNTLARLVEVSAGGEARAASLRQGFEPLATPSDQFETPSPDVADHQIVDGVTNAAPSTTRILPRDRQPANDPENPVAGSVSAIAVLKDLLADAVRRLLEMGVASDEVERADSPRMREALAALGHAAPALDAMARQGVSGANRVSLLTQFAGAPAQSPNAIAIDASPRSSANPRGRGRSTRRIPTPRSIRPGTSQKSKSDAAAHSERMLRQLTAGQEALQRSVDALGRRPSSWAN